MCSRITSLNIVRVGMKVQPTTRLHMFVITQFFGVWTTPEGTKSRRLFFALKSQECARKLRADLAIEEQWEQELRRMLKGIVTDTS